MGSCISCKRNRKKKSITPLIPKDEPLESEKEATEIILKDSSHITIKLTINTDDTTTYTITRPKHTQEASIEIVTGDKEISITNTKPGIQLAAVKSEDDKPTADEKIPSPVPKPQKELPIISESKSDKKEQSSLSSSQMQPHPPLHFPSESRRQRLRFRSQAVCSILSSTPSSSTLSTEPSSTVLLSPSISDYDTESPIGSLSPEQVPAKESSRSLPTVFDTTQSGNQFHSLPGDSSGHFSKHIPLIITSTPPLPPNPHRTPITPLCQEATPLRVPIYQNGDTLSFASFPQRLKQPRRFQGYFRCKECLCDWTSNYTWEGWGQICRRCKIGSSPCYPYRLKTLDNLTKDTTEPHSNALCLRCHFLKRTMDKNINCMSFSSK
ncbi:hypothetical protein LOD99_3308 [Oopsacas minuta]|uniref:Zinc-binding domain-containing protein n=1 Tax=Oopsacas minuta TaxID=111878 RepID=A0AAV7JXY0_9METZ|nr:hypothetical protein LOD99_3308 [Oopsacas minuta]